MRVRWTLKAESDLKAQCAHIAKDDPARALGIATEILVTVEALSEFPMRGRLGRVDGTRELVLAGLPWIAVYAIADDAVVILRLIHGAQSYPPV